mmetsp:Transcript_7664/g.22483  ORF Transcript_7664/g.22483 Transcript_7664/m.22483 type:complete len:243 (-) Transcript_7664:27-755(-)
MGGGGDNGNAGGEEDGGDRFLTGSRGAVTPSASASTGAPADTGVSFGESTTTGEGRSASAENLSLPDNSSLIVAEIEGMLLLLSLLLLSESFSSVVCGGRDDGGTSVAAAAISASTGIAVTSLDLVDENNQEDALGLDLTWGRRCLVKSTRDAASLEGGGWSGRSFVLSSPPDPLLGRRRCGGCWRRASDVLRVEATVSGERSSFVTLVVRVTARRTDEQRVFRMHLASCLLSYYWYIYSGR